MFPSYNLNSFPSLEPSSTVDDDQHRHFFSLNTRSPPSSSSIPCHFFLSSTQDQADQCFHSETQQTPQHQQEADDFAGSYDQEVNKGNSSSLKLSLWFKGETGESTKTHTVKWMSSKMRLMHKMDSSEQRGGTTTAASNTSFNIEENQNHQEQPHSAPETNNVIGSSSNSNISPVRVCADCNTTKTPLWRSGPKGPKSLCNACGIRQRKARRAMAAAAAATAEEEASGTVAARETATTKAKVQQKEKTKNSSLQVSQNKKRFRKAAVAAAAGPSSHDHGGVQKKLCFEEFFLNLSKNLAFHQVFPQDEKEAAILLMALSCGLVHG